MEALPANVIYTTNDTEESATYTQGETRTDLSILTSAGSEPACICRSQYREGQEDPISEEMIHLLPEEKRTFIDLLNHSTFI